MTTHDEEEANENRARDRTAAIVQLASSGRQPVDGGRQPVDGVSRWHARNRDPFPNDVDVVAGATVGRVLRLVTGMDDDVLVWNLDLSTWLDVACRAAGRNLTRAEWEQFGPTDTGYRATCPQDALED